MKKKTVVAYIVMLLVSLVVITFACLIAVCSKILVEDGNLVAFRKLTDTEADHILNHIWDFSWMQVALLFATNLLWATGVGLALRRQRKYSEKQKELMNSHG